MTASVLDRVAVGERKGELVMRLRDEQIEVRGNGKRCAVADGFNVHAATTVAKLARDALEPPSPVVHAGRYDERIRRTRPRP